ncbi:MAG TPA: P27 family phage terminase small subunit [Solirubrobacterales bacterium]|nr:P27 family phage terminase small subunit [Solirubrobacterales bacterium]
MATTPKLPTAPEHLTPEARKLFTSILKRYELEDEEVATLTLALEAFDHAATARRRVKRDGQIVDGPKGRPIAHPSLKIHLDCLASWSRLMGQLGLPVEEVVDVRTPRGHYNGKRVKRG